MSTLASYYVMIISIQGDSFCRWNYLCISYRNAASTLHPKRDVHSICVVRVRTILFQTFFKWTNKYGASLLAASSAKREGDTPQLYVWERDK